MDAGGRGTAFNASIRTTEPRAERSRIARLEGKVEKLRAHLAAAEKTLAAERAAMENESNVLDQ